MGRCSRGYILNLVSILLAARPLFAETCEVATDEVSGEVFTYFRQLHNFKKLYTNHIKHDANFCKIVSNSDFNPHVPTARPKHSWFEGWYARVSGEDGASSFAMGIGHFPGQNLPNPSVTCFILASNTGTTPRLYTRNFDSLHVESPVRQRDTDECCTESPIPAANCHGNSNNGVVSFRLEAGGNPAVADPADFCSWEVTSGSVQIDARLGSARLRLQSDDGACAATSPWASASASSPEGWLAHIGFLLRLRYDVLSLRTPVRYKLHEVAADLDSTCGNEVGPDGAGVMSTCDGMNATVRDAPTRHRKSKLVPGESDTTPVGLGLMIEDNSKGDPNTATLHIKAKTVAPLLPQPALQPAAAWRAGRVHLEKNWGESFPHQWIWAQGHQSDARGEASFVLAGGLLPHILQPLVPVTRQFVFSYHPPPPEASFTLDPRNPALFNSLTVRGCDGAFSLVLYGIMHVVKVVASADPSTFQALPCPTATGFRNYSVESFSARVQLKVLRRPYPLGPSSLASLVYKEIFTTAAMEFGGGYVCPENMPQLQQVAGMDRAAAWGSDL